MQCKYCGSPASDATIYCPACGEKLDGGSATPSRSPSQPTPQANTGYKDYSAQKEEGFDWLTTLLLAVFLGKLGVHRFYTGHKLLGAIMFCSIGCCGIMWLVDIILIATDAFKDSQGRPLVKK